MGFDGWIEFDGTELVNLARTTQLAEALGIDVVWIEPEKVAWIEAAVGGSDYDNVTTAPWYDPGYPASGEFAGLVPLSFVGLDDSTRTATTIEYVTDGGNAGRPRSTTLPLVANVAIVASTERGAAFGKRWLDRRLRGRDSACSGDDLRYLGWATADAPKVHRRNVKLTRGASVTRKRTTDCSAMWLTTFTLTAHDPFEYGEPIPALTRLGVAPEWVGPAIDRNLVPNPSFETGTAGWSTLGSGITLTSLAAPTPPVAPGVNGDRVLRIEDSGAVQNAGVQLATDIPVTGNTTYTVTVFVRGPVGKTIRVRAVETAGGSQGVNVDHTPVSATEWTRVPVTITTSAGATALDVWVTEPLTTQAITFWIDSVMVDQGGVVIDYFDGNTAFSYDPDTDTWTVYRWTGDPHNSTSEKATVSGQFVGGSLLDSHGTLDMVQETCPVYDYTPVYDPLYPALVPSPTTPDFYPDGWEIEPGMVFTRHWARLQPIEPTTAKVVPIITLTSDTESRMVRVSIWPSTSDFDAQCEPLFTAIVTFMPAGLEFTIDGEQQASYVWDGFSDAVRRTDSLVYGTDATPLKWASFNDPGQMLVTLDLFESAGDDVQATVAFVPKSD